MGLNWVPFQEIPVKSPNASPIDFRALSFYREHQEDVIIQHWEDFRRSKEVVEKCQDCINETFAIMDNSRQSNNPE